MPQILHIGELLQDITHTVLRYRFHSTFRIHQLFIRKPQIQRDENITISIITDQVFRIIFGVQMIDLQKSVQHIAKLSRSRSPIFRIIQKGFENKIVLTEYIEFPHGSGSHSREIGSYSINLAQVAAFLGFIEHKRNLILFIEFDYFVTLSV